MRLSGAVMLPHPIASVYSAESYRSTHLGLREAEAVGLLCPQTGPYRDLTLPTLGIKSSPLKEFEITKIKDSSMEKARTIVPSTKDQLIASFGRALPGCPNCHSKMVMACREIKPSEPIIFTFQCQNCRNVLQRAKAIIAISA